MSKLPRFANRGTPPGNTSNLAKDVGVDGRKWRSLVYVSCDGRVAILVLISIQGCRSAGYTQLQHTHAELPQNPSHMNTKNLGVYEGTQFMLHWEFNTQVIASGGTNGLQPRTSEMGLVAVASTTTLGRSQFFPLPLRCRRHYEVHHRYRYLNPS